VPVISVTERENRPGGAANVALNVVAMGAKAIVCAVAGKDEKGEKLLELLETGGMITTGVILSDERPTTVKSRIISGHQHIVRVDEESTRPLSPREEQHFLDNLEGVIRNENPELIIFEDYNKGLLTPNVIERVIAMGKSNGIPIAVDPKKENFFAYREVDLFKPNLKELREGLKVDIHKGDLDSLSRAVQLLEDKIGNRISLITLSDEGIYVKSDEGGYRIPAHIRKISDVSGAGDTVISVAALCLAAGVEPRKMAALANLAGGLVCEKVGVVPIDRATLLKEAENHLTEL
jgi:rfaE bifunctional protein kinase chain/domain